MQIIFFTRQSSYLPLQHDAGGICMPVDCGKSLLATNLPQGEQGIK